MTLDEDLGCTVPGAHPSPLTQGPKNAQNRSKKNILGTRPEGTFAANDLRQGTFEKP